MTSHDEVKANHFVVRGYSAIMERVQARYGPSFFKVLKHNHRYHMTTFTISRADA
jgi:hypothetical protein